jgi:hypothetical protein
MGVKVRAAPITPSNKRQKESARSFSSGDDDTSDHRPTSKIHYDVDRMDLGPTFLTRTYIGDRMIALPDPSSRLDPFSDIACIHSHDVDRMDQGCDLQ